MMRDFGAQDGPDLEASLGDAEFERFVEFFYRRTGIRVDDKRRAIVTRRIAGRMAETGARDFRSYFMTLRFEAAQTEMQELINVLTVNETYFFREDYQLRALVGPILGEVAAAKRGRAPVRIWSMPCATGEEAYSIALALMTQWPGLADTDVELHASDIDTRALAAAEAGVYGTRSLQHVPPALLRDHFERLPDGSWRIDRAIRDCVSFSRRNVADPGLAAAMGPMDVIFCRNMLIYFDDASRRAAVEGLFDVLTPGGFLLLGHSESMSRMSSLFRVRRFADAIVYQKPSGEERT